MLSVVAAERLSSVRVDAVVSPNGEEKEIVMKRCDIRLHRKACVACHDRRSHFRYAGRVKGDRQHNLCFQCFRSVCNRVRCLALAQPGLACPIVEPASMFALAMGRRPSIADVPFLKLPGVVANLEMQNDFHEVRYEQPAL